MKNYYIKGHTSFLGKSGYNNHARNFFTALNKFINVKIRNFSMDGSNLFAGVDGGKSVIIENDKAILEWRRDTDLSNEQKKMMIEQSLLDSNGTNKLIHYQIKGNEFTETKTPINIVLNETYHFYYYQEYNGIKIAYNVWETTRQPEYFFEKLLEYDQLWVPSTWQKQCSIDQGYPEEKVKVIPEGVDNIFVPSDGEKYNKFTFCLIGRWDYRKSTKEIIQTFIDIFKDNNEVELLILVDNLYSRDGYNSTEERVIKNGLKSNKIKILHFLDRDEYLKVLQKSHVFLSCARGEGWNLPLIEAMACGTPSICSDWGAQLEFANDVALKVKIEDVLKSANEGKGKGYDYDNIEGDYCEPDFNHLSKIMKDVYENYKYYKKIAIEKSINIRNEYSWENAAKKAMHELSEFMIEPQKIELPEICYITHTTKNYFDATKGLINSVLEFSEYPIIVYTINFESDEYDNNDRVMLIPHYVKEITGETKLINKKNKKYIDRKDDNGYHILIQQPQLILNSINNGVKTAVHLDGDTIILPNGDDLFLNEDRIINYPLATRGVFETMSTDGVFYTLEEPLKKKLGIKNKNMFYRQAGIMLFNDKCKDFIEEWNNLCKDKDIIKDWKKLAPYHHETIMNVLFWKYGYYKHLPLSFYNVDTFESFVDFMNFNDENKMTYDYEMSGFRLNDTGWQVVPWNKSDIKILHNIKSEKEAQKIINYIKEEVIV